MPLPLRAILLAIFVHSLWGANPVAIKFGLLVFPPFWTAFWRFSIAILCVLAWARMKGLPIWPEWHEWPLLWWLAAIFGVQLGVMNVGYSMTEGSVASVLTATYPMFAALLAHWVFADDRLTVVKSIGLLTAFTGVGFILLRGKDVGALGWIDAGSVVVLAHSVLLGARLVYSAKLVRGIEPTRVVLWQMILSLPFFALLGGLFEQTQWQALGPGPVLGILYQGIVIAGFGFMITTYMVRRYSPTLMFSFGFISPIVGVALSLWLLDERLTLPVVIGVLGVVVGLVLIAWRRDISVPQEPPGGSGGKT